MRTIKRYIPIFLLCIIIWFVADHKEAVTNFFDTAETNFTKQFGEFTSNGYLIGEQELSKLEDSGITGKEYDTFDKEFYPYYDLLTVEGQLIYKQIYANMKHLATTFIPIINITNEELQTVMEAVYNDHPELFWINTSYQYKYISNNIVVQITLNYNETKKNIETAKIKFETITNNIINNAKNYSNDYEKELYVHDELLKMIKYNPNAPNNQSAYSAFINGETVCAGYARAFQYIMIELGIPTYYVSGYSNQDHAWNIVKLNNEYYNVDLTWDDTSNDHHQFFNLTDNEFQKTHKRSNLSAKLPHCQGTKYKYSYPTSEEEIPNSNINDSNIITPSTNDSNNNSSNYNAEYYEHHQNYNHDDEYYEHNSYQNSLHHQNENHYTEYHQ